MKKLSLIFLTAVFSTSLFAQGNSQKDFPFDYSFLADGITLGTLGAYSFAEHGLCSRDAGNWDGTFNNLDSLNAFDRAFARKYTGWANTCSNITDGIDVALPAFFIAADLKNWSTNGVTVAVMYAESLALNYAIVNTLKDNIRRDRPYTYFDESELTQKLLDDRWNSFPSGHTSAAFCGATFSSYLFTQIYPDSEWTVPFIAGAYTLAAGTAVLRVASGKHFPTDVLAGAAIGSFSGFIVPFLHRKTAESEDPLISKLQFTGNGLNVHLTF